MRRVKVFVASLMVLGLTFYVTSLYTTTTPAPSTPKYSSHIQKGLEECTSLGRYAESQCKQFAQEGKTEPPVKTLAGAKREAEEEAKQRKTHEEEAEKKKATEAGFHVYAECKANEETGCSRKGAEAEAVSRGIQETSKEAAGGR